MRWNRVRRVATLCIAVCLPLYWLLAGRASRELVKMEPPVLTQVQGGSWLRQLGTSFDESLMGRTGNWPPDPVANDRPFVGDSPTAVRDGDSFAVTGADLYRFNCQACHRQDGSGVPPVIHSLIGPVRATSSALFRAHMRARGFEVDETSVRELTSQAAAALRNRLASGGDKMPPFPHLQGVELEALLAHLRLLAGVPGAPDEQMEIKLPALRVGEHLVKGTCHICHDAKGPGREGSLETSMLRGIIPSLESFPRDRTRAEVIRKVREGLAEPLPMMTRGRMPILDYLTAEEVGAVYDYLSVFPPLEERPEERSRVRAASQPPPRSR